MAALVFYGGAGINLISFCCNVCRSEGIEAIISENRCISHQHSHTHSGQLSHHVSDCHKNVCHTCTEEHFACNRDEYSDSHGNQSDGDCCSLTRISFDWTVQHVSKQEISLVVQDLFFHTPLTVLPQDSHLTDTPTTHIPHGPPVIPPRDYLSTLRILLI